MCVHVRVRVRLSVRLRVCVCVRVRVRACVCCVSCVCPSMCIDVRCMSLVPLLQCEHDAEGLVQMSQTCELFMPLTHGCSVRECNLVELCWIDWRCNISYRLGPLPAVPLILLSLCS